MPTTILEILDATSRAQADRPAMARKRGGAWEKTTWREYRDAVRQAARALVATGVEPGQGVVILAFNRPEWFVTNLATIAAGGRPAGIYTNSTPEQCRYITEHAEAAVAVVENRESLERLQGAGGRPAGLKAILFYLVVYLFMNLGAFYVVVLVGNATKGEDITDFSGLGTRAPFAAVALAIFLFALTGIPPFSGFIGKVYLFAEVLNRGVYWLAIVAALNSVVSLYYYARIVKAMFLEEPRDTSALPVPAVPRAMLALLAAPTLVLGLYWEPVARIAADSVRMLAF